MARSKSSKNNSEQVQTVAPKEDPKQETVQAPEEQVQTETVAPEEPATQPKESPEEPTASEEDKEEENVPSEPKSSNKKTSKKVDVSAGQATTPQFVTIESADGRMLEASIGPVVWKGKTIQVPADQAGEVRRLLTDGGFYVR